jgi:flagellar biosynthesis protein
MAQDTRVKQAAAISYDPEKNSAPALTAFGEGHVAERIVASARGVGVPIVKDSGLTSVLAQISVGDELPEELYEVAAKLLLFVGELDRSYGERIRAKTREAGSAGNFD